MTFYKRLLFTSLSVIFSIGLLSGCSNQQTRSTSNLVDYLYPKEQTTKIESGTPNLKLPLKIGIAFVPAQSPDHYGKNEWTGRSDLTTALTEAKKTKLLEKIAGHFRQEKFVSDIQVIPSNYLTPQVAFPICRKSKPCMTLM